VFKLLGGPHGFDYAKEDGQLERYLAAEDQGLPRDEISVYRASKQLNDFNGEHG
jgi:hypothetical protein